MTINILLSTSEFRGDHNADVQIALAPIPGETVEHLVARALSGSPTDSLIIRVVQEPTV